MREWLLQDEKAKVGRPKLATENLINKSKKLLVIAFLSCFILSFCFISEINGKDPIKYAYSLTFSKFFGQIENPNGYKVKTYYNKDNNYSKHENNTFLHKAQFLSICMIALVF